MTDEAGTFIADNILPWWSTPKGIQSLPPSTSPKSVESNLSPAIMTEQNDLRRHFQDDFFTQQWFPCTQSHSLNTFMGQEKNGPFLRALFVKWQQLGSPALDSIQELNGKDNRTHFDLNQLVIRQEQAIIQSIQTAMQFSFQFAASQKTFDTFAAQVGLFSSIKAELQTIEESIAKSERGPLYHSTWQDHLDNFHKNRPSACQSTQKHLCLGVLIWGEAFHWPPKALQMAYGGYTIQLQASQLVPEIVQELELAEERKNDSSSESLHSPLFNTPMVTATSSSSLGTQNPSPQSVHGLARRLSKASDRRKSSIGGFTPFFFPHGQDSTTTDKTDDLAVDILLSRRPTMTNFFENGMMQIFASPSPSSERSKTDDDSQQWSHSTVKPVLAEDEVSLDAITFDWNLLSETLSPSIPSESSSSSLAPSVFKAPPVPTPADKSKSSTTEAHRSLSSSHGPSPSVLSPPRALHTPPKRPALRGRSSTMNSMISTMSTFTEDSGSGGERGATSAGMGRERSRRHYARTKSQRTLINGLLGSMNECVHTLWREGQGTTRIASQLQDALSSSHDHERDTIQTNSIDEDGPSSRSSNNRRKRESKQRVRMGDMRSVATLARLAHLIIDIPLSNLSLLLTTKEFDNAEDRAKKTMINVWLAFQHGWGDLVMAEKRFFANSTQTIAVMIQLMQIAVGE